MANLEDKVKKMKQTAGMGLVTLVGLGIGGWGIAEAIEFHKEPSLYVWSVIGAAIGGTIATVYGLNFVRNLIELIRRDYHYEPFTDNLDYD